MILQKAKVALLLNNPFFGSLLLRLDFQENNDIDTCRTNGKVLQYNKKFIDSLTPELVKSVLAHEVMHLALAHHTRRHDRKPETFNDAGDYVINQLLVESGFKIGKDWLHNPSFKDLTTDEVYRLLAQEEAPSQGDRPGGVDDAPGDKEAQVKSEIEWQVAAQQAAQQAKARGCLPGVLESLIKAQTAPRLNWREQLRDFMVDKIKENSTWLMPNRRYGHMGLYLPSINSNDALCQALCYIDTSGSVSNDDLTKVAAEITGILEEFPNIELTCKHFDTRVNPETFVFGGDSLPVEFPFKDTRGGTSFYPVFEDISAQQPPAFLLLFTDLDGPAPPAPPSYPVLWITFDKYHRPAPYGEVISVYD